MTYYCSCGESYTEEIIETGHTFSTWNTTKEATCEETGLKTAVCTVCKQTVEEVIPETGHIDADSNGKCDVCTQDPEPEDEEQVTLKSISVYSEPTKKDYYLGESLDTSGLKLKLTYSDGTTEIVSDGFSTNGFSSVSSGTKTVTVYYNGLKTSFDIEINTVSINIAEESKSMFIGDTYKLSATTVPDGQEIIWKSSDENIVTVSNGVVTAVSDGNATVTASIVVGGKTYSASCNVVVSDPKGVVTSVTIVDEKLKTDYYVGDPLNTSGLQLEVTYADGTKEIISSGFATNGFDSSDAGSKTVVVEYGDFTLNYDITVKPAEERKALYSGTCGAQGDNLTWTLYENGQLVIDGEGDMEDYTSVKNIQWYQYRELVSEILICDGITNIGDYAFSHCDSLTSITIPDSVTSIGDRAFWLCPSLTSITIPDGVTSIGESAFMGCDLLSNVSLGNGVTDIEDYAFVFCNNLNHIKISKNIKHIGWSAFWNTAYYNDKSNWENDVLYIDNYLIEYKNETSNSYEIKNGTKLIAEGAFYNNSFLSNIEIPNSVTNIGDSAFYNCISLTAVYYSGTKNNWQNISIGSKNECLKNALIYYATPNSISIHTNPIKTSYYVGDTLNTSGLTLTATYNNGTTETITSGFTCTPTTLETAGTQKITVTYGGKTTSFDVNVILRGNCGENLIWTLDIITGSLEISGKGEMESYNYLEPKEIPWYYYCSSIKNIKIGDGVTSIGDSAFYNCTNLTNITISDSVTRIGDFALMNCEAIKSMNIPNSVTSIGDWAFFDCNSLEGVGLPESVSSIGKGAFNGCGGVMVDLNNKHYSSDENGVLFNKDKTTIIHFPKSSKKTSYSIPDSVTNIGDFAFRYCSNLTEVIIPNGVTNIGYDAFSWSGLTSVTIPNSVISIGEYAFANCDNLKNVTISYGVESIGSSAFAYCDKLKDVYYDGHEERWYSIIDKTTGLVGANIHFKINSDIYKPVILPPSINIINIGDSIILHADINEALPSGWTIKWTANNRNFDYTVSSDGSTCTITPSKSGDTTFTATVYDENGNEIGKDDQTMTSKAGFFDKIIAFFKKLFGLTKVIQQSIDVMY